MDLVQIANRTIPAADGYSSLKIEDGSTGDIMQVVMDCYYAKNNQVAAFAPSLKGRSIKDTCSRLWTFLKRNVAYKEDPAGQQWVKEPARVWHDKVCDCKSYSIFIASCLHHLGIAATFRFVSFNSDPTPTHVYVVVPVKDGFIKIDCVLGAFNIEKPYTYNYDYCMTKISQLSGIGNNTDLVTTLLAQRAVEATKNGGWLSGARNAEYEEAINQAFVDSRIGFVTDLLNIANNTGSGEGTTTTTTGSGTGSAAANSSLLAQAGAMIKQNIKMSTDVLKSIFTKGGVSPSFFGSWLGGMLKFFDNSTDKWKSRSEGLKNMTPADRLSWYIDLVNKDGKVEDALQYNGLFGSHDSSRLIDDRDKVPYLLAKVWNDLMLAKFCRNSIHNELEGPRGKGWYCGHLVIDLTRCPDYMQYKDQDIYAQQQQQQQQEAETYINEHGEVVRVQGSSSTNMMLLIGAGLLAFLFLKK